MGNDRSGYISRIVGLYIIAGIFWILLNDVILVRYIKNPTFHSFTSVIVGGFFIIFTGLAINFLLRRWTTVIDDASKRFQNTFEQAAVGIAHVSTEGKWLRVNQRLCEIVGYSREELLFLTFQDITYPNDLQGDLELVGKMLAGEITRYDIEKRYIQKNGKIVWIRLTVSMISDEKKVPLYFISVVENIDLQKKAESELTLYREHLEAIVEERSEQLRLLSKAVIQSPVCVVITDVNGNIKYVNPKFTELTGYEISEVVGSNPRILKSDETPTETYKDMWDTLISGHLWQGEFCNRKKNGELYWEIAYIAPVSDLKGIVTHYVAVKEDITERKRQDEKLRELSLTDDLTALSNRRGFNLLATQQLKIADRNGTTIELAYLDLDRLKWINDTFGHSEGDRAISGFASVLRESFRDSDIIARIGGDEFVVLSVDTSSFATEEIIHRLRRNLKIFSQANGFTSELSVSIGITSYSPENKCTLEELLLQGDQLMYEDKRKRRTEQI